MANDQAAEHRLLLSMLPAGPGERRAALAAMLLSLAVFLAAVPFARVPLWRVAGFIPCYEAALVICDLITAALLVGQFTIARPPPLLALAGGYLFTTLMTTAHALSFPGLFAETGLLGAGPQSTAWLYMFWHGGFPLAVLAYARLEGGAGRTRRAALSVILSAVAVVLPVAGLTALATVGAAWLPGIMDGDHYTPAMIFVVAAVWSLSLLAFAVLLTRRPRSVLDWWLMAVLGAWLCDVALSAVFNAGRFDVGFYVGRVYGLAAASGVLIVLLLETIALYARLARTLEAEGLVREQRLVELRSELIHVARLSELGLMVSALAHEVNQPLTAIGNYLRAGQRLLQAGDTAKTQLTLGKAVGEVTRAAGIIQRLRDYIRKGETERHAEDLGATIEETIALALVGAEGRAVAIDRRLGDGASAVLIDKVQIQQVLLNLIRNAIEAMADGPRRRLVLATARTADAMVEVSVADNGPGLAETVRSRLFQPFVTTKSSGMGVGLSICRSIVEAHGGRLWAEDNPDGGTVFRFTLPQATPSASQSAAE